MTRKLLYLLLSVCLASLHMGAQKLSPITWEVSVENNTSTNATIKFAAAIENGWHLYGFDLPDDGPNSTSIAFDLPRGRNHQR